MEETSPQDIEKLYIAKEKEELEELITLSIPIINAHLKDHYKELVKWGKTAIGIEDLSHIPADYGVWSRILIYLRQFFKSWQIDVYYGSAGMTYEFKPRYAINTTLPIDMNKLTVIKEEKEVKSDDIIDNRADILDLGEK